MDNKNKESKQETVEETTNQQAPVDETKTEETKVDTPENPEEEKVTLSKKEFEDLQKRAIDYDRSIELKRLKKLEERGELKTETGENVKDEIAKLREEISTFKTQTYNSNLREAYNQFVSENPWANDDAKFDKIKDAFVSSGTETKEELFLKLKSAAQNSFPVEYEQHLEDKIKKKLMSTKVENIQGGAASSDGTMHKDTKPTTEADKIKEKMAALYAKSRPSY